MTRCASRSMHSTAAVFRDCGGVCVSAGANAASTSLNTPPPNDQTTSQWCLTVSSCRCVVGVAEGPVCICPGSLWLSCCLLGFLPPSGRHGVPSYRPLGVTAFRNGAWDPPLPHLCTTARQRFLGESSSGLAQTLPRTTSGPLPPLPH